MDNATTPDRFYLHRIRFYTGVVAFIVGVGLPLTAIPSLRHRLGGRLAQLKESARGYSGPQPIEAQVGQNREPFPAQFEKPIVIPQKPAMPLLTFSQGKVQMVPPQTRQAPPPPVAESQAPTQLRGRRTLRIPTTHPGEADSAPPTAPSQQAQQPAQQEADTERSLEPIFVQGEVEKEAYNLVLQKYTIVAGMVTGNNPSLQYKNWSAAKREEDTYWVRLIFQQTSDRTEIAYIWEVKVAAKQVTPLNYNARSLPKS